MKELAVIKKNLMNEGRTYFQSLKSEKLDALLSINNYHSALAASAEYPTLTVPMGYQETGEPLSLTFVGLNFSELKLFQLAYLFEKATKARVIPKNYQ